MFAHCLVLLHKNFLTTTNYYTFSPTDQQRPNLIELTNFKTTSGSFNIAEQIGVKYKTLGIQLLEDATGAITDTIEKQCLLDAADINMKIIQRWITGQGKKPVAWSTLIEVLRDIQLSELADEIELNLQVPH